MRVGRDGCNPARPRGLRSFWSGLAQLPPCSYHPPRPGQVMSPRVGLLWGYSILCLFSYLASLLFQPLPRYTRE